MNIKANRILTVLLLACSITPAYSQSTDYAAEVARTAMAKLWRDGTHEGAHPRKWTYDQSVVLLGIEGLWYQTADATYFNYMQQCMDRFVGEDGTIDTYEKDSYNIDNIACGRILLALYKVTGKEKYFKAARTLRNQLKEHPRTAEGSFWHKKIYPSQVWLDGLYMGQPFLAEWALTFKEGDSTWSDIAAQFINVEKHTRDDKTGLLYHAWDESKSMPWADKATGKAPNVWARAMGWYGAALVDVLDYFPEQHPKRKELITILNRLAAALQKSQDKKSGLWWDVMNAPYPGQKENYFESSAAAQFVYTLAKGFRLGLLPKTYLTVARKGYEGITAKFVARDTAGYYDYTGTVNVSGLGGKPYRDGSFAYYMSEKVVTNDPKGVGAFIQAANEMKLLNAPQPGKDKQVLLDSYFNNEYGKNILGNRESTHYKFNERSNGGFEFWAKMLERKGAKTATTYEAPTKNSLSKADVYVIVDPDIPKENPEAKFMDDNSAHAVTDWVRAGGTLILLLNDTGNCDLEHINILTQMMGFHFNKNSRNHVQGKQFEQGALYIDKDNPVFRTAHKVYLKEISTIAVDDPSRVRSIYSDKGDVLMVTAKIGKGKVFAVGDPWIYNEYVDGRKLPADFDNYKAMNDLSNWALEH
jgi:unsaturated rhamnogalacturonyl hydrolase